MRTSAEDQLPRPLPGTLVGALVLPDRLLLIAAVAAERVAELVVSRRNLAWSRARGGVEIGAGHEESAGGQYGNQKTITFAKQV